MPKLSNLWTQFSLCQNPNNLFCGNGRVNFQIYVESQGVPHNQNNPKKKEKSKIIFKNNTIPLAAF